MRIYNTMSGEKEVFAPLVANTVGIYVCGPTVYDYMHVGNARPIVTFDTVRRYFLRKGYNVKYVQNFTDVDDKIINRAAHDNSEPSAVADRFVVEAITDMNGLGCMPPTVTPRVTQEMEGIKAMVQTLIDKGYAYEKNGSVFYSTGKFHKYGCLSGKNQEDLVAGARVEANPDKANQMDFVLWKPAKPGEPKWESPWSEGRPGWHIECSVMSKKYLGDTFDIHAGGEDLIFPHHENEIAQSEAANGKTFARYWMHVRNVMLNGRKMSKSEHNFLTIRDAATQVSYAAIRFYILSSHYRSPINFSIELLEAAKNGLERIRNCVAALRHAIETSAHEELLDGEVAKIEKTKDFVARFDESMEDDFNTADALTAIFDLVSHINAALRSATSKKAAQSYFAALGDLCQTLGLETEEKKEASAESQVEALIAKRQEARKAKDYKTADEIRHEIEALGVLLSDTPQGPRWSWR
ncbi:MAG: cysteine--tRNA ligase [Clostridiales bacterium]|nr:cysteine--tRNA ligase [Clostridiales bacterium]